MPAGDWARSLPGGQQGTIVPTLVAELGDAPDRWQSVQHLQAQAGMVPVTSQSGKHHVVGFRWACNMHLRYAAHTLAFVSLCRSDWALAYYRQQRARGHSHHRALRALGAKWLKIIFAMRARHASYDENAHVVMMARQQCRQVARRILLTEHIGSLSPGTYLGSYEVTALIGQGGMGEVRHVCLGNTRL